MAVVGIASVSQLAADAGARIAEEGGNAVEAAVAGALVSAVVQPGMCSLGGGGFATVWPPDAPAETVDGGFEMPGRSLPPERFGRGRIDVHIEYGGGVFTVVGPGSVATPGALALLELTARRHGRLPWRLLVEPSIEHARRGFPLPAASHEYLLHGHESMFGWCPDSHAALHDAEGSLLGPGETVRVPYLAESLEEIAREGAAALYRGELGHRIATYLLDGGGILTPEDLAAYRPEVREPLLVGIDGWEVATNPPPAVGGAALAAMLLLMEGRPRDGWTTDEVERLIRVQEAVLLYRSGVLERSDALERDVEELLKRAGLGDLPALRAAGTVHTSAVDDTGLACAITLSDGYGSGAMAPETGIWLNNCLGEPELTPEGYHSLPPGRRLISNMAPTVARRGRDAALAIGSPGADRITTSILQVLVNHLHVGLPLQAAVDAPRLHVELVEEGARVAYEPGLPVAELAVVSRAYDAPSMFFGGVEAVAWTRGRGFDLGADRRRTGGTAIAGRATTEGEEA